VNVVEVINATRLPVDGQAVARAVDTVLRAEDVHDAELAVSFVGEDRMRALNGAHRGRDEVTDVLSFPLEGGDDVPAASGDPGGPPRLLGDVVICARQALRQARGDGSPPAFEVAVLLVHGVLHLLGHDHEVDAGEMALRQADVLELVDWEALVGTTD
jgi:probable rRNA maturation factor